MNCPYCGNVIDPLVEVAHCKAEFDLAMERAVKAEEQVQRQSASIRSLCMELKDPGALKRPNIPTPLAARTIAGLEAKLSMVRALADNYETMAVMNEEDHRHNLRAARAIRRVLADDAVPRSLPTDETVPQRKR